MVEFSNHLGDLKVTNLLEVFWGLSKFTFLAGLDTGNWHLLVYLIVDSQASICFVYVHEDGLNAWEMLAIATSMWHKVCCALS